MDSTEHLRLFVALPAPDRVKENLEGVQNQLRRALADKAVRWARAEQFHLTLRFLGSVAVERVTALIDAAQTACRPFAQLQLTAQGLGFFPDARFPRVLWVGVKDSAEQLGLLWQAVQRACESFTTEAPENSFVGHITLARINRLRRSEAGVLVRAVEQVQNEAFGQWTATELHLMRSELSPRGARHSLLAALPLLGR